MGMNDTPVAERLHIGIFGRRNAGKSSVINAITGQSLAIVSDVKGTTTDPVEKAMELLPLGPVVLIDTAGLDDHTELGDLRMQKTWQVLRKTDMALLVVDARQGMEQEDEEIRKAIEKKGIPYLIVMNKADLLEETPDQRGDAVWVSAKTGANMEALKEAIVQKAAQGQEEKRLLGDLLELGDMVVLVVPIDKAAPKGRLILPQQQAIRDILEAGATAVVCRDTELVEALGGLAKPPALVVTDSQVFEKVAKIVPEHIPLTSFSILFARYKGDLPLAIQGAAALKTLKDGDRILIAEGCTHHRQCGDIGTVKLPSWIRQFTGVEPAFHFTSGTEFPEDLGVYKLVVHCGGCMLNQREMQYRIERTKDQGVPMTNYGVLIAYMNGILARCVEALGIRIKREG